MDLPNHRPSFWEFSYPSQRMPVMGSNVVATSQPLAAQAGLRMLLRGGNAVDAALAAAITLTVVEPTGNGLGSDAFAQVWDGRALYGYNGSGRSPAAWTAERFAGLSSMPVNGWEAVTVPGAVDLWVNLWRRFGRLPFEALFEPAVAYARESFPVAPFIAARWAEASRPHRRVPEFAAAFLPSGRPPRAGEPFALPAQADTLEQIARSQGEDFYRGALAQRISAHAAAGGGALCLQDLESHQGDWVTPLSVAYRGVKLHEIPPNGQGLAVLIALGVLRHFDLARHPVDSPASVHLQIEAMKVGFELTRRHVADPEAMEVPAAGLLDDDRLAARADAISLERAARVPAQPVGDRGTVYLSAADASGMMVSLIQSNFMGFGSGVVIPDSGISLQNRASGFTLQDGHPNRVAGDKRPFHTIIPAFVTHRGGPLLSFGVMGGHMQPQGQLQLMVRLFDYGQNPQAAADAPRWQLNEEMQVMLEPGFAPEVAEGLRRRGHRVTVQGPFWGWGGAQLVYRLGEGYCAASDPRKDGQAVAF